MRKRPDRTASCFDGCCWCGPQNSEPTSSLSAEAERRLSGVLPDTLRQATGMRNTGPTGVPAQRTEGGETGQPVATPGRPGGPFGYSGRAATLGGLVSWQRHPSAGWGPARRASRSRESLAATLYPQPGLEHPQAEIGFGRGHLGGWPPQIPPLPVGACSAGRFSGQPTTTTPAAASQLAIQVEDRHHPLWSSPKNTRCEAAKTVQIDATVPRRAVVRRCRLR
jgi:hypothetical protein